MGEDERSRSELSIFGNPRELQLLNRVDPASWGETAKRVHCRFVLVNISPTEARSAWDDRYRQQEKQVSETDPP